MHPSVVIIRDEHRSLSAVLKGLNYLVREIREGRAEPDFKLFGLMLHYIEHVPNKLHHPKEDQFLFAALRRRDPASAPLLDALVAEHQLGYDELEILAGALRDYQHGGPSRLEAFAAKVAAYLDGHWEHMTKEEELVIPRALAKLTVEDWDEVDRAFLANSDPLRVSNVADFREVFRRIAALAPTPIGFGPASGER